MSQVAGSYTASIFDKGQIFQSSSLPSLSSKMPHLDPDMAFVMVIDFISWAAQEAGEAWEYMGSVFPGTGKPPFQAHCLYPDRPFRTSPVSNHK